MSFGFLFKRLFTRVQPVYGIRFNFSEFALHFERRMVKASGEAVGVEASYL